LPCHHEPVEVRTGALPHESRSDGRVSVVVTDAQQTEGGPIYQQPVATQIFERSATVTDQLIEAGRPRPNT